MKMLFKKIFPGIKDISEVAPHLVPDAAGEVTDAEINDFIQKGAKSKKSDIIELFGDEVNTNNLGDLSGKYPCKKLTRPRISYVEDAMDAVTGYKFRR